MSWMGSETRKYQVDYQTERCQPGMSGEPCCNEEHDTIAEAFACGVKRGWGPRGLGLDAIDWAFGMRAVVPTCAVGWVEAARLRKALTQRKTPLALEGAGGVRKRSEAL